MSKKKAQQAKRTGQSRKSSEPRFEWEPFLARRRRWIWGGLAALLAVLYLSVASNQLGGNLGGDNAQYLFLAKALATGQGYVDLHLPDHPPHAKYPPFFPLLLAPLTLLGSHQLLASHLLICALALLVPFSLAGWARGQGYSEAAALGVLLLVATVPRLYEFLLHILSDQPFLAFSYFALWRMAKANSQSKSLDLVLIIAATLAALFTRTAGIALVAALALEFLRRSDLRRLRSARIPWPVWFFVIVGLAFAAWSLRNRLVSGTSISYLNEFLLRDANYPQFGYASPTELGQRFLERAFYYLPFMATQVSIGSIFFLGRESFSVDQLPWLIPVLIGLISRLRRSDRAAEWFFLLSAGLMCGWWYPDSRFILPLLPLAGCYLLLGVRKIFGWILTWIRPASAPAWSRYLAAAAGLLILLNQFRIVAGLVQSEHADRWEPAQAFAIANYGIWREPVINWAKYEVVIEVESTIQLLTRYIVICRIAAQRVPAGSVILSRKPTLTAWFADRPSICYLFTTDTKEQWKFLKKKQIEFVLVAGFTPELSALFDDCPDCFQVEAGFADGYPGLYRIVKSPAENDSRPASQ